MRIFLYIFSFLIWAAGLCAWVMPYFERFPWIMAVRVALWGVLGADLYMLSALLSDRKDEDDPGEQVPQTEPDITELITRLNRAGDREELLNTFSDVLDTLFNPDGFSFGYSAASEPYTVEILFSSGHVVPPAGTPLPARRSMWGALIRRKAPLCIRSYANQDYFSCRMKPGDLVSFGDFSMMAVPMRFDENSAGIAVVESEDSDSFSEKELEVFQLISLNFASAFHRLELIRKMKEEASSDGLTGVLNHRAFREKLFEELYRARRYEHTLTLFMLDLDNFKRINDEHGHLFGDYMLKAVSDIVKNSIRMTDTAARYGGEEFTVILVNTDAEQSCGTAERIRKTVEEFTFEYDGIQDRITVSIGIASFPSDSGDAVSLIKAADEAMYNAKRAGKNRVNLYETNGGA